ATRNRTEGPRDTRNTRKEQQGGISFLRIQRIPRSSPSSQDACYPQKKQCAAVRRLPVAVLSLHSSRLLGFHSSPMWLRFRRASPFTPPWPTLLAGCEDFARQSRSVWSAPYPGALSSFIRQVPAPF